MKLLKIWLQIGLSGKVEPTKPQLNLNGLGYDDDNERMLEGIVYVDFCSAEVVEFKIFLRVGYGYFLCYAFLFLLVIQII